MLKEILGTPKVLGQVFGDGFKTSKELEKKLGEVKRIFLVGSGTSYHAGLLGQIFFEDVAGVESRALVASEWNLDSPRFKKGDLAVFISQSGETAEILLAFKLARESKVLSLAVSNNKNSTLAKKTDFFIDITAGTERSIPATKSFSAEVAVFLKLAFVLARDRKVISSRIFEGLAKESLALPRVVAKVLSESGKVKRVALKYKGFDNFIVTGSALTLPLAHELALKLKESAIVEAEAMPLGEVRHGPLALAGKKLAFIFLVEANDRARAKSLAMILKKTGSPVLAFDSERFRANDVIVLPKVANIFTPLVLAPAFQIFAYWLATLRGYNVDRPKNLTKSVRAG
ncbi:MAG: glucosamine--fructose-6-phosphate aminotransferase (isomerizing) [Parcubacteria group bacterium Gr01-1014_20]|nr:MAG: glucosamine--fructose-6-phosphate aminotransferase (isomerizing) [Parcubacteria group bacterium Gr01-1014_20]